MISATDDSSADIELTRLRLADSDSGIPEVVRCEEAAVGVSVSSMTCMSEELSVSGKTDRVTSGDVEVAVVLGDKRGPSPPDRDITEPAVAAPVVSVSPMTPLDTAAEAEEGKVPVHVEVHVEVQVDVTAVGTLTSGIVPPRTDTTAGVDRVPTALIDGGKAGCSWSATPS